jgi:hypothetical protein
VSDQAGRFDVPGDGFWCFVITRPTIKLSWDDLDAQGCADHGAPDWDTMITVGPNKTRDARGNVTLQWTVTVHCEPAPRATPATPLPALEALTIAELDPVEPPPVAAA